MERPNLPENCVEYAIYILNKDGVTKKPVADVRSQLEFLIGEVYSFLSKELVEYIWHVDPFRLHVIEKPFAHIGGRTVFGDSIEDEWFIVHLMLEITKRWDNVAIAIRDDDGEFLLIEAADHLPAWLGPENSTNRVWLHRGAIHIVPEVVGSSSRKANMGDEDEQLSVEEALAWIAKDPTFTAASKKIQDVISSRIDMFPKRIKDLQHRMQCCVPAGVAVLATAKPSLVSAAVQAFYLRDPIDLRACKAMKHFPPETRVLTNIAVTKLQYAQLLQQKYNPDKRTGWDLPAPDDPHYKALDLGVKLASGFEILCCNGEKDSGKYHLQNVSESKEFEKFLHALEKLGYFKKKQPGSREYETLKERASDFFERSWNLDNAKGISESPGVAALRLLKSKEINMEELKKLSHNLPPADDDSWLNVTPEEVEHMLRRGSVTSDSGTSQSSFDPAVIADSLKKFMSGISGLQGVEFPEEKGEGCMGDMDDKIGNILDLHISEDEDEGRNSSAMTDYSDDDEHPFELAKGSLKKLQTYLHQMDRELAATAVGRSFERKPAPGEVSSARPAPPQKPPRPSKAVLDDFEEDDVPAVDAKMTLVKNFLGSLAAEEGMPGPASNLLKRMGVVVPPNAIDSDDE